MAYEIRYGFLQGLLACFFLHSSINYDGYLFLLTSLDTIPFTWGSGYFGENTDANRYPIPMSSPTLMYTGHIHFN